MNTVRTFNKTGPLEIKPQKTSIWICQCGHSKKFPFCDGSHARLAKLADARG